MDRMGTMDVSVMYEGRKMDRIGTMDVSVIHECMMGGRCTGWERCM